MQRHVARVAGLLFAAALFSQPASAVLHQVNSTGDGPDANTSDGKCETATPGVCTLRAAVQQANVTGGTVNVPAMTIRLTGVVTIENDMSIVGAGMRSTVVSGNGLYAIFRVTYTGAGGHNVTISDMTLRDGHTESFAAAIHQALGTLTIDRCFFTNNYAPDGGAVLLDHVNTTIRDSVFADNHTTNTSFGGGGAVWAFGAGYSLTIIDVAFTGNSARHGGALIFSGASATLTNVTLGGNTAEVKGGALALYPTIDGQATVGLYNTTVAGNRAYTSGGGIHLEDSNQTVQIRNAIVANNYVGAPSGFITASNCNGTVTSLGNSIVTSACTVTGSYSTSNPMLGPLQENGGPNGQTYALLTGSPARDGGTVGGCPLTDQRGVQRQVGVACDMGAYEHSPCGDANGDGALGVADVFSLINYIFAGGPVPSGLANVNGDSSLTVADVFYLINRLFASGPAPTCAGT
jgi:CSLREA domain-containing protein